MNETKIYQLDFFKSEEQCEIDALREQVNAMKISLDKQRKSLFARSNEVGKMCYDINERLTLLERNICYGR